MVRDRLADDLYALSFSYGQKHARELQMASWQAARAGVSEHRVVDLRALGEVAEGGSALTDPRIPVPDLEHVPAEDRVQPPTYVPNRNMVLLAIAASWAETLGATRLFYGAQVQDRYGYWDCTVDFVARMNDVLSLNRREGVRIVAPLVDRTKAEIVSLGLSLGVDFARTWSCYQGGEMPCGSCPTCVERRAAFEAAGVRDPLTRA